MFVLSLSCSSGSEDAESEEEMTAAQSTGAETTESSSGTPASDTATSGTASSVAATSSTARADTRTSETDVETTSSSSTGEEQVQPAPRFFTVETPSGRYLLPLGASATIQLAAGSEPPSVSGTSIELIDLAPLADGGNQQWEMRAVGSGTATVTVAADGAEVRWEIVVD
jgi:hypothetical protein